MTVSAPVRGWRMLSLTGRFRRRIARVVPAVALVAIALLIAIVPLKWMSAVLLGIAAVCGIILAPGSGLVLLALALPFGGLLPSLINGVGFCDTVVSLVAVSWLAKGVTARGIHIRSHPVLLALLPFLWFSALSLTNATSLRDGLTEWLKWVEFAVVLFLAVQVVDRRLGWWIIGALFTAGATQALIGADQFLRQSGPAAFILSGNFMRAYGTLRQPNPYAGYLGYLAPLAASACLMALVRYQRWRLARDLQIGVVCAGLALLLSVGIGMSWSRGGWLALAAALLVVLVLSARSRWRGVGFVIAVALGLALVGTDWLPASVTDRLQNLGSTMAFGPVGLEEITDANFAVLERLAHWRAGLAMFGDRPWLGIGIGNYNAAYAAYALPHWYDPLGHAHNFGINLLAETGVLGAGAFAVFWVVGIAFGLGRCGAGRTYRAALATGILGAFAYLTVHSLFDNLFVQHLQLQLALMLGVLVALTTVEARSDRADLTTSLVTGCDVEFVATRHG